ncbi:unnamed protein product [Effrenium voratum]|uniref:Uncharacterized protein n=1 Tax=Effrenium voratum TaxID=2562239 RepID=A0AA36HU24_9DINO|nr:unnamed protein product [Effrenium voratum]CAJ1417063.1 unnamed protein product [Effrenium voratum]
MAQSSKAQSRHALSLKTVTESGAICRFLHKCRNDESGVVAMTLKNDGARHLLALGSKEDNFVAASTVAKIFQRKADTGKSKGVTELEESQGAHFGAVYEHRDSAGKPRLIGSTDTMPEKQFALDSKSHAVRSLRDVRPEVVWAGVGLGEVGAKEMAEVRQAVLAARSERLQIEKLGSVKPYSRHT